MSGNNGEDAKRRRVEVGGGATLSMGREGGGDGLAQIAAMMNQLLDQNRAQTTEVNQLLDLNHSQMAEMKSMRGDIKSMTGKIDRMEGEIKSLRGEVKYLREKSNDVSRMGVRLDVVVNKLRYHDVLLKNQKWEYPVIIPDIRGDRFLSLIKARTCEMRYGKGDGSIDICDPTSCDYDVAFLPHWKEFASALEEYKYALKCLPKETESILELWDVELPKAVLDILANALESTHFKSLQLGSNYFGRDGIQFALDYMRNNPVLEDFVINNNVIGEECDLNRLCEIIEDHPAMI